jgi:hypothetical protein
MGRVSESPSPEIHPSGMTRHIFLTAALLLPLQAADHSADICIYGGTSAGVVAAVQGMKMGKSVILLEPGQHLGSMATEGLGGTDIDNHGPFQNSPAVGGLALEYYRRIAKAYGREEAFEEMLRKKIKKTGLWRFEPHVAERVFDDWAAEAKVKVIRGARLVDADAAVKKGATLTSIRTVSGDTVSAKVFIDATFEGDLLAAAGVTCTVGREGNAKYGETLNGIVTTTRHSQFEKKVDPYKTPGDPASGLIFGVSDEPLGEHGATSPAIQAFAFRNNFTKDPALRVPFAKPDNYDVARYELQRRFLEAGGDVGAPNPSLPTGKTDPGGWHHLTGNMPNWNHKYPEATNAERQKMLKDSLDYIKGLCWFLANDPAVPEKTRAIWSQWGTTKDEFTDNGGWPRTFYVRNGRRMVSDFVLIEQHGTKTNTLPVEDPVAMVWWPHDLHNARRIVKDGFAWNEGAVFGGTNWIPFGVPYRSLHPKAAECDNLLTPTCPSSSYVAYGAYRIEFTFMAAAQATATAASIAIDNRQAVQKVDYAKLRERLLADGQVIAIPAGTF